MHHLLQFLAFPFAVGFPVQSPKLGGWGRDLPELLSQLAPLANTSCLSRANVGHVSSTAPSLLLLSLFSCSIFVPKGTSLPGLLACMLLLSATGGHASRSSHSALWAGFMNRVFKFGPNVNQEEMGLSFYIHGYLSFQDEHVSKEINNFSLLKLDFSPVCPIYVNGSIIPPCKKSLVPYCSPNSLLN